MNKPDLFEEELTKAMRHVDAPKSLEVYLMNAAEAETHRATSTKRVFAFPRMQSWFGGAMAALLVLGSFGAVYQHRQQERAQEATQQFEASQRITDHALELTRQHLAERGIRWTP